MTDIERRIQERNYSSPATARGAINRSQLPSRAKVRLLTLVTEWENSEESAVVVGGLPEAPPVAPPAPKFYADTAAAHTDELKTRPSLLDPNGSVHVLTKPLAVNLNELVRVRFTLEGLTLLYAARGKLATRPEELDRVVESGGEWEAQLWELMLVLGSPPPGTTPLGSHPLVDNLVHFPGRTVVASAGTNRALSLDPSHVPERAHPR